MSSRVGSSFSVTMTLKDRAFDAASVSDLEMIIPMNGLPYGTYTLMVTNLPDYKVESGCYGNFMFLNTGHPGLDGKGFSYYVINAVETLVNEATVKLRVKWRCANEETLAVKTMSITGTSLESMIDILKSYEHPVPYINEVSNQNGFTDTMTWRYVNATLEDMLVDTVNHSAINGDYLFWAYDEVTQKIRFSTLNTSKKVSPPLACVFSQNALSTTQSIEFTDPNTKSRIWLYAIEERSSQKGENIGDMFPNIVFSNVTSNGKADISKCGGECFDNVVRSHGAMSSEKARKSYGISSKDASYGELTVVDHFPLNTHKSYSIAYDIRKRILSEYGKIMNITILNTIGPPVGSRVYVRALKVTKNGSNGGPDMFYTDTYIVLTKKIIKDSTISAGALGNAMSSQNDEYACVLVLGSCSDDIEGYKPTTIALNNIADACKVEMDKRGGV